MAVVLPKRKQLPGMLGVRLTGGAPDWFWSGAEKAGLSGDVPEPRPEC